MVYVIKKRKTKDNIELERNGDNYIFKNIVLSSAYLSDEVKYHKECKTSLSLALFTDDKVKEYYTEEYAKFIIGLAIDYKKT